MVGFCWFAALPSIVSASADGLATQEIRYRAPRAGEVWLVWGIDGWKQMEESRRPPGTVVRDGVMQTPMSKSGTLFVARLRVHPGTRIEYGFLTTKTKDNSVTKLWQADGDHDYGLLVRADGSIEIPSIDLPPPSPEVQTSSSSDAAVFKQHVRYRGVEAEEVWFVWGVDGWKPVPQPTRPAATVMKKQIMHSPMLKDGEDFSLEIQVPAGSIIHYGFLAVIGGVEFWQDQDGKDFETQARERGTIDVVSSLRPGASPQPEKDPEIGGWGLFAAAITALIVVTLLGSRWRPNRKAVRVIAVNMVLLSFGLMVLELWFGNWIDPYRLDLLNIPRNVDMRFDVSHLYASETETVVYRRDRYGLRGPYDSPASIDILTIGGSTTDQRAISEGETWQDVLSQEFASHGLPMTVANAGVDGQSTYGHIKDFDLWFPRVPDLRARFVLFYVGLNDFWADAASSFDDLREKATSTTAWSWSAAIRERSALYYLYRTVRGMAHARLAYRLDHHHVDWDRVAYVDRPAVSDHERLMRERLRAYEERLKQLVVKVRDMHARPIFVTQVYWSYKLHRGTVLGTAATRRYGDAEINGVDLYHMINLINSVTMRVCKASDAVCIDLAGELAFDDADFYDGAHNTPRGAAKVGRYLYTRLAPVLTPPASSTPSRLGLSIARS